MTTIAIKMRQAEILQQAELDDLGLEGVKKEMVAELTRRGVASSTSHK